MSKTNASQPATPSNKDRQRLRSLLINGSQSMPAAPADSEYFASLRTCVRKAAKENSSTLFRH